MLEIEASSLSMTRPGVWGHTGGGEWNNPAVLGPWFARWGGHGSFLRVIFLWFFCTHPFWPGTQSHGQQWRRLNWATCTYLYLIQLFAHSLVPTAFTLYSSQVLWDSGRMYRHTFDFQKHLVGLAVRKIGNFTVSHKEQYRCSWCYV